VKKVGDEWQVTVNTRSEKYRADTLGKETPAVLQDYIDIGVFGEAQKGRKLGKPLAMRRVKIARASNTYTFSVREQPASVGIDPYNYLVDRIPDDNVKAVE
jgi:hypothetical protein